MIRVAFAGASGTGKTTLARFVSEKYDLPLNPVGSRSTAKKMGFDNPYDVDAAGKRREFQHMLQREKVAWEMQHDAFVTDRTVLDEMVYTTMHDVKAVDLGYFNTAVGHMRRYTHVIYCPVYAFCKTGDDLQRVHDMTYQKLFDAMLDGYLMKWNGGGSTIWISSSNLEDRKKQVADFLGGPAIR